MNITINNRRISGALNIPEYEPLLHRYLICQALTEGHEESQNFESSSRVDVTVKCLAELMDEDGTEYFNCSESELSYRYLLSVAAAFGKSSQFYISEDELAQPIADFLKTLKVHGIRHEYMDRNNMRIWGRLTAGTYIIPASINAQFVSGLLLALPLLEENSILMIDGVIDNIQEINTTIRIMTEAGIKIESQINKPAPASLEKRNFIGAVFKIAGKQKYNMPLLPEIEGDWNIAAYLLAAGAVCGGPVTIAGINTCSDQKGIRILDILEDFGAVIEYGEIPEDDERLKFLKSFQYKFSGGIVFGLNRDEASVVRVSGNVKGIQDVSRYFKTEGLKAADIDASDIPELIPAIVLLASASKGTSRILNADLSSRKSRKRIQAVIEMMEQFGIMIWESEGCLYVEGYAQYQPLAGGNADSFDDPYIAMLAGAASSISSAPVTLENCQTINKLYPTFFDVIRRLQK